MNYLRIWWKNFVANVPELQILPSIFGAPETLKSSGPHTFCFRGVIYVNSLPPVVGKWNIFSSVSLWIHSELFTMNFTFVPKGIRFEKTKDFNGDGYSKFVTYIHMVTSSKLAVVLRKESWRDITLENGKEQTIRRQTLYGYDYNCNYENIKEEKWNRKGQWR